MEKDAQIKKLVARMADIIREIYKVEIPILDMVSVIQKMGGEVAENSSVSLSEDAKIEKVSENSFKISITPSQSKAECNSKLAKALGHLILGMGFRVDCAKWDKLGEEVYICSGDTQSNAFAGAFLMPEVEFEKVLRMNQRGNVIDTEAVAEHFHVPMDMAACRGRSLGYLHW